MKVLASCLSRLHFSAYALQASVAQIRSGSCRSYWTDQGQFLHVQSLNGINKRSKLYGMKETGPVVSIRTASLSEAEVAVEQYLRVSRELDVLNERMDGLRKVYRLLGNAWDFLEVREGTLNVDPCVSRQFSALQVDLESALDADCLTELFLKRAVLECELQDCTDRLRSFAPQLHA